MMTRNLLFPFLVGVAREGGSKKHLFQNPSFYLSDEQLCQVLEWESLYSQHIGMSHKLPGLLVTRNTSVQFFLTKLPDWCQS